MKWLAKAYKSFEDFWYGPQPLVVSALFRITVGATLFVFYVQRLYDFEYLFSEKGIVPYSLSIVMVPDFFKTPFLLYPASESVLYALHYVFLFTLLLLTFGVGGRVVTFACWILHLCFFQRNAVITYGPDFIATCWLMYMWLLKTDGYLTLKQWIKKESFWPSSKLSNILQESKKGDALNSVGLRFIQIQLCIIYGYGGLEKLKGLTWWRGEAIWNTLANGQIATIDFGFIAHFPYLIAALTFTTLMFEIYFPALIWNRNFKPWLLGFGVLLHVGIGFTMNIPFFSILMILSYITFLPVQNRAS